MASALRNAIENHLGALAQWICNDMQNNLISGGHVDTGELLRSIRYEIDVNDDTEMTAYIIADAKNPTNNAQYAEFIEMGTGAAHGRAGGREGYWHYQDLQGKWHTTNGMDADPFIAPAIEANKQAIESLAGEIAEDIAKYWRLKGGDAQ